MTDLALFILAGALAFAASRLLVRPRKVSGPPLPVERLRMNDDRTSACGEFTEEEILRREIAGREIQRRQLQFDLALEIAKLPYVEPAVEAEKPVNNVTELPVRRRA